MEKQISYRISLFRHHPSNSEISRFEIKWKSLNREMYLFEIYCRNYLENLKRNNIATN